PERSTRFRLQSTHILTGQKIDNRRQGVTAAQLDRPNKSRSRLKKRRLPTMSPRRRADAQSRARRPRLHRLSRRQRGAWAAERTSAHPSEEQRVLENFGQTAEFKRVAQSRVA